MSTLRITSVNIQVGVARKLSSKDVIKLVDNFDIFCLQETWLTESDSVMIDGYNIFRSDRKTNKKRYCGSGGVITLIKSELLKGITKVISQNKDMLWCTFDKKYYLDNDIYMCNCYIPP